MILSDREVQLSLHRGHLSIKPMPSVEAFASTAVDLRLDALLQVWNPIAKNPALGIDPCFCPGEEGFNVREVIKSSTVAHDLTKQGHYRIPPRGSKPGDGFILAWTREKIRIPHASRMCARVEGKSSLARLGLGIHVTAPTIHAGFGMGQDPDGDALQLEIWNVGPLPIELRYEMPICQLIFEEVHGTPVKGYSGQFQGQGPKPPA